MKKVLVCLAVISVIFGCSDNGDKSGLIAKEVENARNQILAKESADKIIFENDNYELAISNNDNNILYLENADNLFIFSLDEKSNVSMGMTSTNINPESSDNIVLNPCKKNNDTLNPYGYTFITSLTKEDYNSLKDILNGTENITDLEYLSDAKAILNIIVSKTTAYPYSIDKIKGSMQLCR